MKLYARILSDKRAKDIGVGGNEEIVTQLIVGSTREQIILGEVRMTYNKSKDAYAVTYSRRGANDVAMVLEHVTHSQLRGIAAYPPESGEHESIGMGEAVGLDID